MFKHRDGWRVSWYQDGRRRTKFFKDKKEAQVFELQREMGIVDIAIEQASSPTFSEWSERWLKDYCQVHKAKSQQREDASVIRQHLLPAFGKTRIVHLKKSHLETLKASLTQKARLLGGKKIRKSENALKPKTVNNILALAKKMLATAVDFDVLQANPFQGVKPVPVPPRDFKFWAPSERDNFIEACRGLDPEFSDLVLVACHTGLRLGELAGLRWSDLDLARRKLRVVRGYDFKGREFTETTKGKKSADLPLNQVALDAFDRIGKWSHGSEVFPIRLFNSPCCYLKSLCEMTETQVIRFHDLRHTFASCLAMAGVDLMVIQKLMRHRSYQTTLVYAHLHPDHLVGATEILCSGTQTAHTGIS